MSDVVTAVDAARAALAAAEGTGDVAVVAAITPDGATVRRMIVHADGTRRGSLGDAALDEAGARAAAAALREPRPHADVETITVGDNAWLLYVETHRATEHLLIVGAGHIAVPLARLGLMLDFRVTVLDDREEFASADRFDDAVAVIRSDFATDPFAGIAITEHTWIALVTRGHRWDFDCLRRVIRAGSQPRYIGMIGSRRRVRAAFTALLESGVPREALATIRAPIGLELHAETPAEIAVAVAAEIIAIRHGAEIASISSRERVLDRFLSPGEP